MNQDSDLMDISKMDSTSQNTSINDINSTFEVTDNESNDEVDYRRGQLAWAQVGNYPYWPCIISNDPEKNIYFTFKDNGQRAWVHKDRIIPFEGREKFFELAEKMLSLKSKSPKGKNVKSQKLKFTIARTNKKKWETGVQEAEKLLSASVKTRLKVYSQDTPRKVPPNSDEYEEEDEENDPNVTKGEEKSKEQANVNDEAEAEWSESETNSKKGTSKSKANQKQIKRKRVERRRSDSPLSKSSDSECRSDPKKTKKNVFMNGSPRKSEGKEKSSSDSLSDPDELTEAQAKKLIKSFNLFRGIKPQQVCRFCEETGDLIRCKGPCLSYFHSRCVRPSSSENSNFNNSKRKDDSKMKIIKDKTVDDESDVEASLNDEEENFRCLDCWSGIAPDCLICSQRDDDRVTCGISNCGMHFHPNCLTKWPNIHGNVRRLTCSYHVCHTCSSNHPQNSRPNNERLVRCVRCPSAYHANIMCVPAGSIIITGSQIICPKHLNSGKPHNANWCFRCTSGGTLISCDRCPTACHPECLVVNPPDGNYICEDCKLGRMPLYGEVVWVKFGSHNWWPAQVCYPDDIPEKIISMPHLDGEFVTKLFLRNDYIWVNRGKVCLLQDDGVKINNTKNTVLEKKAIAMDHVTQLQFMKQRMIFLGH